MDRYSNGTVDFSTYNAESCYWAGWASADGCVYRKEYQYIGPKNYIKGQDRFDVCISAKDRDFFNKITTAFGLKYIQERYCKTKYDGKIIEGDCLYGSVGNKALVNYLGELWNIIPRKSLIYRPPTQMPKNEEFIRSFIRGNLDGDGTVYWRKPSGHCAGGTIAWQFLGTRDLMQWISDTIREYVGHEFRGQPGQAKRDPNLWRLYIASKSNAKALAEWLYVNSEKETRLERKYLKAIECALRTTILPENTSKLVPRKSNMPSEMEEEICEMYRNDYNRSVIARKLDIDHLTVTRALKRNDIVIVKNKVLVAT